MGVIGKEKGKGRVELTRSVNVDGAVRDEDTFVVGDDEDDDASDGEEEGSGLGPPPPYESSSEPSQQSKPTIEEPADDPSPQAISTSLSNPYKYYLKPNDNLKGIALRFNVNVRQNNQLYFLLSYHNIIYRAVNYVTSTTSPQARSLPLRTFYTRARTSCSRLPRASNRALMIR